MMDGWNGGVGAFEGEQSGGARSVGADADWGCGWRYSVGCWFVGSLLFWFWLDLVGCRRCCAGFV